MAVLDLFRFGVAVKADVAVTILELPVEVAMALIADLASPRLIARAMAL